MTYRTYYRLALLLPFVFPLLLGPFHSHTPITNNYSFINIASTIRIISMYSILYGGIPYIILVGFMLFWISNKNERQVRKIFYFLPVLFIPVFSTFLLLFFIIMDGHLTASLKAIPGLTYAFGIWILIVGYFYIALIQCTYLILKSKGAIKEEGS